MSKPEDIPQDVWDAAEIATLGKLYGRMISESQTMRVTSVARAILADRATRPTPPSLQSVMGEDKLAELLAGLENTTPGPYRYYVPDPGYCDDYIVTEHPDHAPDDKQRFRHLVAVSEGGSITQQNTGKHLARCDPDTIRSFIARLQDAEENARMATECFAEAETARRASEAQTQALREALEKMLRRFELYAGENDIHAGHHDRALLELARAALSSQKGEGV